MGFAPFKTLKYFLVNLFVFENVKKSKEGLSNINPNPPGGSNIYLMWGIFNKNGLRTRFWKNFATEI